jgi:hypothetical protein
MNISFSTTDINTAKKYFTDPKWSWLSDSVKEIALKHLGKNKLRVQDPAMYPDPILEITERDIYNEIMDALAKETK